MGEYLKRIKFCELKNVHQEHRDMFLTKPYKILRLLSMVKPAESKKTTSRMYDVSNISGISYLHHIRL